MRFCPKRDLSQSNNCFRPLSLKNDASSLKYDGELELSLLLLLLVEGLWYLPKRFVFPKYSYYLIIPMKLAIVSIPYYIKLYSGLRQEEIIYLHNTDICNNLGGCSCNKLHVIKKPNGLTVVIMNLFKGHKKCYFTILPTLIFEEFRRAPNFDKGALLHPLRLFILYTMSCFCYMQ